MFTVIIENKILADIAEKEFDEDDNIQFTQLDNYKNYFLNNKDFCGWDRLCILLSYKNISNFNDDDFVLIDYKQLYEIILKVKTEDDILKDYKILLNSLLNSKTNKEKIILLSKKVIFDNRNMNLNDLEIINKYLN